LASGVYINITTHKCALIKRKTILAKKGNLSVSENLTFSFYFEVCWFSFSRIQKGIVSKSAHSLVMVLIGLGNVEHGNYTSTYRISEDTMQPFGQAQTNS
jgi:hypothetical protein